MSRRHSLSPTSWWRLTVPGVFLSPLRLVSSEIPLTTWTFSTTLYGTKQCVRAKAQRLHLTEAADCRPDSVICRTVRALHYGLN
ncbi:hypothetical protein MHYP_G00210910 [Metynnis hypsauchen]